MLINNDPNFLPSNGFTISLWLTQAADNVGYIFAKSAGEGTTRFYALHLNSVSQTAKFEYRPEGLDSGFRTVMFSDIDIADGLFHHIAVTVYGDYFLFYLDGAVAYQTILSGVVEDGPGKLCFGKLPNNDDFFEGSMHTVLFYDEALSSQDIETLAGIDSSFHLLPECRCPTGYLIATETMCTTPNNDDSTPRINSLSHDSSFVNDEDDETYWQSATGISDVNITVDLQGQREIIYVSMYFVSSIPYGIAIHYSTDGITFSPRQYYARDCSIFGLPNNTALSSISDVNCISKSVFHYPFTNQLIEFLLVGSGTRPNANTIFQLNLQPQLQLFALASHVRIQLFGWHPEQSTKEQYFSISDIVLAGQSCICNGHASSCNDNICICQHNTVGDICEQCLPIYNNQPWQAGTVSLANPCQECQCNNHSTTCIYNATLDAGICIDCQYHTTGQMCEECTQYYYHPSFIALSSPERCQPCDCHLVGITDDGDCARNDEIDGGDSGNCSCKNNVGERDCGTCIPGFYNLSLSNSLGCQPCACNISGTISDETCDLMTGQCVCLPGVEGRDCSRCEEGYYGFGGPDGCLQCHEECVNCFGSNAMECLVRM